MMTGLSSIAYSRVVYGRIAGKFRAGEFSDSFRAFAWRKKVWRINRSANGLLIVSTNLNGFSLVNRGRFAKFAKLSRYTVKDLQF